MLDSSLVANSTESEFSLPTELLMKSIHKYCQSQLIHSSLLSKSLDYLLTTQGDWQREVEALSSISLEVQWLPVLQDLLVAGDVMVFKTHQGGLGALVWEAGYWLLLQQDGKTSLPPSTLTTSIKEAALFRIPKSSSNTEISNLSGLSTLLKTAWAEIGLSSLMINGGLLLLPLFTMLVYDKVLNNGVFETLWALTIGMFIYIAIDIAMRLIRTWSVENIAQQLSRKADQSLWQKVLNQSAFQMGFSRMLTYYRDLSISRDFISSYYLLALVDMPFLVVYLLVIALIAWPLAITAAILVMGYTLLSYLIQRQVIAASKQVEQTQANKMSFLSESLQGLDVIRTSPQQRNFEHQWRTLSVESAVQDARRRFSGNLSNILTSSISTFTSVSMLVVGAYLVDAKLLSVGGLIACNLLASRAMSVVSAFYTVFAKWQDFQRSAAKLEAELGVEPLNPLVSRTQVKGDIDVVNAGKVYPGFAPSLQNVNLHLQSGERVALLGKPGAGKTTLMRALAGLVELSEGNILVDGVNLKSISLHERGQWLAWKGQAPCVFSGTLEENLLSSGAAANSEALQRAMWVTGLDDELRSGKLSLDMLIQERGSNLSGGQLQKIALTRTLAQQAKIVMLDEPTLGLDPDTERQFAERLNAYLPSTITLIMTTHSSHLLPLAKRVIALNHGKVIADGPTEKVISIKPF